MFNEEERRNEVVQEGIESFPENRQSLELLGGGMTARQLLDRDSEFHEKYHGEKRPGCILVKKRREKTYQDHYLDIYTCLTCGLHVECLRGGWEIGWAGGTESAKLA